jgi:transcriptional regulator with XRE-family HTH domain
MSLGNKIYHLRIENNISQEMLASELDVSRQSISKWETEQSVPELDKIVLLSKYFHVSMDSLINDDSEIEHKEIPEDSSQSQKMKLKRVARILLKTCFISTPLYLVFTFLVIIFQRPLIMALDYRGPIENFIFPFYIVFSAILYTFINMFFSALIYQNLHYNKKSIILEILALCVFYAFLYFLSLILNRLELQKYISDISFISQDTYLQYTYLNQLLSMVSYIKQIPNICFLIGCIMSLTIRKIDYTAYINPKLKEAEHVGIGFQFLSFFMGLIGSIPIWILSIVLIREWKIDQPQRKEKFTRLFIIGVICSVFLYLIALYLYLIINHLL